MARPRSPWLEPRSSGSRECRDTVTNPRERRKKCVVGGRRKKCVVARRTPRWQTFLIRTGARHEHLLAEIRREFPTFAILRKRESALQRAIALALWLVTFGQQRHYLKRYHTVLFGRLYVPDAWDEMGDVERYILLRHERIHLVQRRRMGDVAMMFVYLFPILPMFLAWGRARIEWEAYVETIRATAETLGLQAARNLEDEIVRRYVGPDYGWMWPFPGTIRHWFRDLIADLAAEASSSDPNVISGL
jgi:hypothetical protein